MGNGIGQNAGLVGARRHAQGIGNSTLCPVNALRGVYPARQLVPVAADFGQQPLKRGLVGYTDNAHHRLRQWSFGGINGLLQNLIARFGQKLRRLTVVCQSEMRAHTGFQWKATQQAFAKRMNGLDFEAAGGFKGAGK